MKMQLHVVVCVLVSAGLVAGQVYHIPTVSMVTPDNSSCPSDSQLESIRSVVSRKISDVLVNTVGCVGSGWRQVAFLNMRDPNQTCPQAWRLYEQDSVRSCGRHESGLASCNSVWFSTDGYAYTQVCGRITGHVYASPDAGRHAGRTPTAGNAINEPYVDGVSITYGTPRQHVWSFYASVFNFMCCSPEHTINTAALGFIGNNSFCDIGNPTNGPWEETLFSQQPLWDGITHCADSATCCTPHSGPWFHATLPFHTIDDVEVRICGDEVTANEDTPLELVEIYVK